MNKLCSLETMDSENEWLRVSLAFSEKNQLPDGSMNKTVSTIENWGFCWKLAAMDGLPLFVMNCSVIQV